ncbi:TetR/AcrR family transcriptional regulator [Pseudomonas triclosanedens]|uniref:TetR/AcrR family transcriptional regulator n=1 Tax=Pseudomonas triclosanedens TaxID=2961893 RepID=UPI0020C34A42|nr:TetR/AcrR family transcriptional regulator [Pseudomonas triclosanedens]
MAINQRSQQNRWWTFMARTVGICDIRREAVDLFFTQGFHAVSLRKLASAVGLEAGSLYHHIDSKQELLFEIVEEYEATLLHKVKAKSRNATDREQQLRVYVTNYISFMLKNRQSCVLSARELHALTDAQRERVLALRRNQMAILVAILGVSDCADIARLINVVRSMLVGVIDWLPQDGADIGKATNDICRIILATISPQ